MVLYDSITTMKDELYPRHEQLMFHISGNYESSMFIQVLRHE